VRFNPAAGYDFAFAYDIRVRFGAQVKPEGFVPMSAVFWPDADKERQTVEFKVFTSLMGKIPVFFPGSPESPHLLTQTAHPFYRPPIYLYFLGCCGDWAKRTGFRRLALHPINHFYFRVRGRFPPAATLIRNRLTPGWAAQVRTCLLSPSRSRLYFHFCDKRPAKNEAGDIINVPFALVK
jgi:hypothetical protein